MFTVNRIGVGLAITLLLLVIGTLFKKNHDRTQRDREAIRRLREQYPIESLESRLPPPSHFKGEQSLTEAAVDQLRKFESAISAENELYGREARLKKLHDGSVEEFVSREGFGVARMFGGYAESVFALGHQKEDGTWVGRNKATVPQVSAFSFSNFSDNEIDLKAETPHADASNILKLHFRNVLHFANPAGFGTMKDRRNVAGFQPHQFNELLEEKPWKIVRLELVGLLSEERPRVYVTGALPRMQDLRGIPTRSPDAFEAAGLEKLLAGDDLFIRDAAIGVRMLGAIRSARECVACHGGERGALLGAFSYGLRREPRPLYSNNLLTDSLK